MQSKRWTHLLTALWRLVYRSENALIRSTTVCTKQVVPGNLIAEICAFRVLSKRVSDSVFEREKKRDRQYECVYFENYFE